MAQEHSPLPEYRVFVSSPGDVSQEREIAQQVLHRVAGEFAHAIRVQPYFWEHEPMVFTEGYQEQIPRPSQFDLVVCILWSRLGSRLHSKWKKPDGSPYRSGTEFEVEDAIDARKSSGSPDIYVWVNKTEPRIPVQPREVRDERLRQWDDLQHFLESWTIDSEEKVFSGALNLYNTLDEFELTLERSIRKILQARLREDAALGELPQTPATWTQGSPFRGLETFDESHSEVFAGRTRAIDECLNRLRDGASSQDASLVIVGASGSGKSSLARAGLIPFLTKPGVIESVAAWRSVSMIAGGRGGGPYMALAEALLSTKALPELQTAAPNGAGELAELLKASPKSVIALIRSALGAVEKQVRLDNLAVIEQSIKKARSEGRDDDVKQLERQAESHHPQARLIILVDQLEELVTQSELRPVMGDFLGLLMELASSGQVFVVSTLRSDVVGEVTEFPEGGDFMRESQIYPLSPPNNAEIGLMIRQPAAAAGLRYEKDPATTEGLDEVLRDDACKQPEALPLLEHVLELLYQSQAERGDALLRLSDYQAMGGLKGALTRHAEDVFASLPKSAQEALPRVLENLVLLDSRGHGSGSVSRARAKWDELEKIPGAAELAERFVQARLFSADRSNDDQAFVTVTHEALLREWKRVSDWISENAEFLRIRKRLGDAAADWHASGKVDDLLLSPGRMLNDAQAFALEHQGMLSAEEVAFVDASVAKATAHERRRLRIRRQVMAGLSLLSIVAVISAAIAYQGKRQADFARLAAEAAEQEANDATLSLLTANAAMAERDGNLAEAVTWYSELTSKKDEDDPGLAMDRLHLSKLLPQVDRFDWRVGNLLYLYVILPTANDDITFFKGMDQRLFRSSPEGSLDPIPLPNEDLQSATLSDDRKTLYLNLSDKVVAMDAFSLERRWSVAAPSGSFESALWKAPDGDLWSVSGNELTRIDPTLGAITETHPSPLPRGTTFFLLAMHEPTGQAFAAVTVQGERRFVGWTLGQEELDFDEFRHGTFDNSLRIEGKTVAMISRNEEEGESLCSLVSIATDKGVRHLRLPWIASGFSSFNHETLELCCSDGFIRTVSHAGALVEAREVAESQIYASTTTKGNHQWVTYPGGILHVLPSGEQRALTASSVIQSIQPVAHEKLAVLTHGGIEWRSMTSGEVLAKTTGEWDDLAIDEGSDTLLLRKGDTLSRHSLQASSRESSLSPSLAQTQGVGSGPLMILPRTGVILASTEEACFAHDLETLAKREQVCVNAPSIVERLELDRHDGAIFASIDQPANRIWLQLYGAIEPRAVSKPMWLDCLGKTVTATAFGESGTGEDYLLIGFDDGSAWQVQLPDMELSLEYRFSESGVSQRVDPQITDDYVREIAPTGGERVNALCMAEGGSIFVARSNSPVMIYSQSDSDGGFDSTRSLRPFRTPVSELRYSEKDGLLVWNSEGDVGRMTQFGTPATTTRRPESNSSLKLGNKSVRFRHLLLEPRGRAVKVVEGGESELLEDELASTTASFLDVQTSADGTCVAAIDYDGVVMWSYPDGSSLTNRDASPRRSNLAFSGLSRGSLSFIDSERVALASDQVVAIASQSDDDPSALKIVKQWQPLDDKSINFDECAANDTHIAVADEGHEKSAAYLLEVATGDLTTVPLAKSPRSLQWVGSDKKTLLVGASGEVYLIELSAPQTVTRIQLPRVEGKVQTYYVRHALPLPDSSIVCLNGKESIWLMDMASKQVFGSQPAPEYVWHLDHDPETGLLHWQGDNWIGSFPAPIPLKDGSSLAPASFDLGLTVQQGEVLPSQPLMQFSPSKP